MMNLVAASEILQAFRARYLTSVQKAELLLLGLNGLTVIFVGGLLLLLLLDDDDGALLGRSIGGGGGAGAGWGAGGDAACPPHLAHPHGAGAQHPQFAGYGGKGG